MGPHHDQVDAVRFGVVDDGVLREPLDHRVRHVDPAVGRPLRHGRRRRLALRAEGVAEGVEAESGRLVGDAADIDDVQGVHRRVEPLGDGQRVLGGGGCRIAPVGRHQDMIVHESPFDRPPLIARGGSRRSGTDFADRRRWGFLTTRVVGERVRVAFVSLTTAHHGDGWYARRLQAVAERVAARGHDVTVCCVQWWDGDHPAFDSEGVTYRRVTADHAPRAFVAKLPFVLDGVRPDVIHVATRPHLAVPAAKAAGRLRRTPVVAGWWASPDDETPPWRRRLAARSPARVLVPSNTVGTTVRECGAADDAIEVIPDSVDVAGIRDAPVDPRADVVYARSLDAGANVEGFLLALAELRGKDWRAAVIGDGPARADAERAARDLRIDDRVEFLGALDPADQVPILKGAHVVAQTATWAPFATSLLRALACGCVGVVEYQADSAAHELVEEDPRGSLVTSPRELADEIVAAADLERWTVNEAYASYDHEAVLDRYVDCYETVVADYGFL